MESSLEKTVVKVWHRSKWLVKGCIIGVLALLMMIPMMYVKDLIYERAERQKEATSEIRGKWAGPQNIIGPVIGIPFRRIDDKDTSSAKKITEHIAYFLPDNLDITATVDPKEKHRGIFKVMLYETSATINGSFNELNLAKLNIRADDLRWNEAFVTMNIADNKGLKNQLTLNWNDSMIELSPRAGSVSGGMTALLKTGSPDDLRNIRFSTRVDLNGSGQLYFTPIGKSTTVKVNSPWADPSFTGSMLPQSTLVSDSGFEATWKSMAHTRNFPQQWIDEDFLLEHDYSSTDFGSEMRPEGSSVAYPDVKSALPRVGTSAFGVDLYIPVNGYQKILRTIKYALLCILLTFVAFFLIETTNKQSAHPFQYGLIGLALVLFYTLLLSISEYTGFNAAYIIASTATIGLIGWFARSILRSARATTILSVVLVLIYSYVFSLLQLQDYSLLLGSIGLFLTLAVVMHFSKKMQW